MKGILKKQNGKWCVSYPAEKHGIDMWYNNIPVYDVRNNNENIASIKLAEKLNIPVNELEGKEVEWTYRVDSGMPDYDYAIII